MAGRPARGTQPHTSECAIGFASLLILNEAEIFAEALICYKNLQLPVFMLRLLYENTCSVFATDLIVCDCVC